MCDIKSWKEKGSAAPAFLHLLSTKKRSPVANRAFGFSFFKCSTSTSGNASDVVASTSTRILGKDGLGRRILTSSARISGIVD